jgi:hypothetical protein
VVLYRLHRSNEVSKVEVVRNVPPERPVFSPLLGNGGRSANSNKLYILFLLLDQSMQLLHLHRAHVDIFDKDDDIF